MVRCHAGASGETHLLDGRPTGRAIIDRQTIHVHDRSRQRSKPSFRESASSSLQARRTLLVTPLLREGVPIGVIMIRRTEVRPFTDKQIELAQNLRRPGGDRDRERAACSKNSEPQLEALEQQTATSEILGVIASSPTDIQPVLDVVAENAARLCDAIDAVIYRVDGDAFQLVAAYGPMPVVPRSAILSLVAFPPAGRLLTGRRFMSMTLRRSLKQSSRTLESIQQVTGTRTVLATPLLREGVPIGAIVIRRTEVRPFYRQADRAS